MSGAFSLRLNPCKHCLSFLSPTASVYFSFTLLQFHLLLPIVLSFLHHCSGLNLPSPTEWGSYTFSRPGLGSGLTIAGLLLQLP